MIAQQHAEKAGDDRPGAQFHAILRTIGLQNPGGRLYLKGARKYQQILAYVPQIESALSKLSAKRTIVMLDAGCGKSYLSFLLYAYCTEVLGREVRIVGIDRNPELIDQCREAASELGFSNMEFYAADVESFAMEDQLDIVYSLHACDTATDQTIAKGVEFGARFIFSVSCCQHTNRHSMRKHPMKSVSRHTVYGERLADMVADSMRALLLEHLGYGVKVFEYVASEWTPKNVMLRAVRNTARKTEIESALTAYERLADAFSFRPELEGILVRN
jgi:SAM-dependent methyltransferase